MSTPIENPNDEIERALERIHLPDGMKIYTNTAGMSVIEIHHTADPQKDWAWARAIRAKANQEDRANWDREMNLIDSRHEGRPYWKHFREDVHAVPYDFRFVMGSRYLRGYDFGLQPAIVWCQVIPCGQWQFFMERCYENASAIETAPDVVALSERVPALAWTDVGDPAGIQKSDADGRSPFTVYKDYGIDIEPGVNDPATRRDAVNWALTDFISDNPPIPRVWIDRNRCPNLFDGMMGGYKVRVGRIGLEERVFEDPIKNWYSHVNDAFQQIAVRLYLEHMGRLYTPGSLPAPSAEKRQGRLNYVRRY